MKNISLILVNEMEKKTKHKQLVILVTICILLFPTILSQEVFAVTTLEWQLGGFPVFSVPLNQGNVFGIPFTTLHVEDTDLAGNSNLDSINVLLTSTAGDSITITLTETADDGLFDSGRIVLMQGADRLTINGIGTITIEDTTCGGSCNTSAPDILTGTDAVSIFSDSDFVTGITPSLTETGDDTRIFTGTYNFKTSGSSSGTTLLASQGNVLTYVDNVDGESQNAFIIPGAANEGAISAIPVGVGIIPSSTYFVTASYNGITLDLGVTDDSPGGRGSGGLIRPGLVVDNPSSGGGNCNGDCSPPTLGVNQNFNRIVDNGFSYNNNPINVELFYTPYPLITANVGQQNTVVLKIYDDSGIQNIEHVALAFGLGKGERFNDSKATISLDRTHDGREITSVYDPENALDEVEITTLEGSCGNSIASKCLIVTIHHIFREPLAFNMVATYVWDFNKNSWQNYYNDGIEIVGQSLNPPKTKMIAFGTKDMRGLYELTQIDKKTDLWVDEFGTVYEHKGNDRYDIVRSQPKELVYDKITKHGCDRNCNWFKEYMQNQELLAQITFTKTLNGKSITDSPDEPFSYFFDFTNRANNPELEQLISHEKLKAEKIFANLFPKINRSW